MSHPTLALLGSALIVTLAASAASAQPAGAQAEVLFRQGKDLLAKGKVAEACDAFDASQKLDPTTATLLNQASCREKNRQLATAWGLFLEAERQTRAATDAAGKAAHAAAVDHAAKLEPRLSTLTITVAADGRVGGLEILRNGEPVDAAAWNKALPIDGGAYKITARAPGYADWTSDVTVGPERDAKAIEIPKLKAADLRVAAVVAPPRAAGAPAQPAAPRDEVHHRSKVLPIAFGVGALALGGGAVAFALSGNSTYSDAKAAPTNAERDSLWHKANNKRYTAEALGGAGIVCAGVAVWLLLRGDEHAPASGQAMVAPYVGAGGAGVALGGGF